jgi:hypothetical protein
MDTSNELVHSVDPDGPASVLLTTAGTIRALNASMALALGEPAEKCIGRDFAGLLPETQRTTVKVLVSHVARSRTPAIRVLEFQGHSDVPTACLVQAQAVRTGEEGHRLVWVREVDAQDDLDSLLIPFRLAAKAADLGVFVFWREQKRFEWLGGSPRIAALAPADMSAREVTRRVHPDDRQKFWKLVNNTTAAPSAWTRCRFRTDSDGRRLLAFQNRLIRLGRDGPRLILGMVRDETQQEARRQELLSALDVERDRARQIAGFSAALIRASTEQELTRIILTRVAATFGGTGALLALVDGDRLRISTDARICPQLVRALDGMPLDASHPLAEAIRTGEPQFITDKEDFLRRFSQQRDILRHPGADAAMAIIPLSPIGGQPLGAWSVAYDRPHQPSPDERALISTLADLAGQALTRIRLQQGRMELATVLQETMLSSVPQRLPGLEIAARYQAARDGLEIGGDWYDAFPTFDDAVALTIGDAQGHDVDAAAFMGRVRASMRAIAAHEPDPATVLGRTNDLLIAMDVTSFASCTFLRFDPQDGKVVGASAGHVPLVWARDDGTHGIRELAGGPVLGVLSSEGYLNETFALDTDTVLIMVTDGVVEGPGLALEAGLERAGELAAQALHDGKPLVAIADEVLHAALAVDHVDDVAALLVRRA